MMGMGELLSRRMVSFVLRQPKSIAALLRARPRSVIAKSLRAHFRKAFKEILCRRCGWSGRVACGIAAEGGSRCESPRNRTTPDGDQAQRPCGDRAERAIQR